MSLFAVAFIAQALLSNGCTAEPGVDGRWIDDVYAIEAIPPRYPEAAAAFGAAGLCWISHDVTTNGRTTNFCTRCRVGDLGQPNANVERAVSRLIEEQFADQSRLAIGQWRYEPQFSPHRCVQTTFAFLLEGQTEVDLPPDPADLPCLETPQS